MKKQILAVIAISAIGILTVPAKPSDYDRTPPGYSITSGPTGTMNPEADYAAEEKAKTKTPAKTEVASTESAANKHQRRAARHKKTPPTGKTTKSQPASPSTESNPPTRAQ